MRNFKEIAEKCLAGELSGTFVFQNGQKISSSKLQKYDEDPTYGDYPYYISYTCNLTNYGFGYNSNYNVIDFIPDNMQKKIEIDIPEGKVPVMEQTENGVVITWKEKELTCSEIYIDLFNKDQHISAPRYCNVNNNSRQFNKKVEVLRKLTNIRNYFEKPSGTESGFYIYKFNENEFKVATTGYSAIYANDVVAFTKREYAQAAINMLGDELKYLFEPW